MFGFSLVAVKEKPSSYDFSIREISLEKGRVLMEAFLEIISFDCESVGVFVSYCNHEYTKLILKRISLLILVAKRCGVFMCG